jgi:sorbitol-specific phosphotransferase system component IIC
MADQNLQEMLTALTPLIIILFILEAIWKLIAMWKAARNNHLAWFICIALINTTGILPIVNILMHRKKSISSN